MSIGDSIGGFFERLRPGPRVPAARRRGISSEALTSSSPAAGDSKLQEEHDRLAREFVILQWDLGGLAYEMARRDYFRTEVIAQQAAKLQQVDSSLGQAERMLRLEQEGVASSCASCGAMQARGAVFCWQCGTELIATTSVSGSGPSTEAVTEVQEPAVSPAAQTPPPPAAPPALQAAPAPPPVQSVPPPAVAPAEPISTEQVPG